MAVEEHPETLGPIFYFKLSIVIILPIFSYFKLRANFAKLEVPLFE
jgi:hypothetical protein